jgi:hypothetical protein
MVSGLYGKAASDAAPVSGCGPGLSSAGGAGSVTVCARGALSAAFPVAAASPCSTGCAADVVCLIGGFSALASSSLAFSAWCAWTAFRALTARADIQASDRGSSAGLSGTAAVAGFALATAAVAWSGVTRGRDCLPAVAAAVFLLAFRFPAAAFLAAAGCFLP